MRAMLAELPVGDAAAAAAVTAREAELTKPRGALGRLEELTAWLARWQGRSTPRLERVRVAVFAANHGVAARGVSAYPASVTAQMVANFEAGGAAVCRLAEVAGAELHVHALELDAPTGDVTRADALDAAGFARAVAVGAAAVPAGLDLLAVGEMGIANTTVAAALAAALTGGSGRDWVGRGTGVDDEGLARKAAAVDAALARHADADDPLEALRRLGGRELVAMAAAIVAARHRRVPVLIDGFVASAAALALVRRRADALDHCRLAHLSAETGHRRLAEALGLKPLLALDMRLGEASGAALAIPLVRAALACHLGMATFGEAAVDDRSG
ncbi:MAG: nicotinate-nucleotide--dimethylbenzimidazole phosphoribosyltransferase [Alphaproteobacteria bacterium]|jgi:nicotinate-nucleotide--dimethylbenzimidazole phosphoribosyltransferase|nr:nicotinate-nucleotide--dimethylbenzimidazole phosphoribosyltransferase [Alphaproteobacteria bacterium]